MNSEQTKNTDPARRDWQAFTDAVEDYAIFMLDESGRVATWNRGAEKIKGYAPHEIIGSHFSRFYTDEDNTNQKPQRELEIAQAEGRVEDEGWRVRKDGTLFWANVTITVLRDERGNTVGYTKVTRDLTARRAAEEELRRSEERFRLLLESVSDYAMYMLDPRGYVSTWNTGAQNLKGYGASEIIGQHFSRFFSAEDVANGKPERELETARTEGRFEEEGYRVRKDGTRFWANVILTPIRDSTGALMGFAKVTRDLTARRKTEQVARELVREQAARAAAEAAESRIREAVHRAEEAARRAEEASRIKDEFLATISHELRTPLNAIVGWSAVLRSRTPEPAVDRGLEIIHRNALAQSRIIEDILDVSRIVSGKLRVEPRVTDAISMVNDAVDVVRAGANAKDIELIVEPIDDAVQLVADPDRLRQVLWNLLSNAVKFTEPGGSIRIAVHALGTSVEIVVSDTGRGIDPAFLPFVFDRFRQADSSSTRRVGGLGLGLSIVRHIVELHGGTVEADSDGIGKGSTFRVCLPTRLQPAPVHSPSQLPPTDSVAPHGRAEKDTLANVRVFVVDDQRDARDLVETVLAEAGAEVYCAESVEEALHVLPGYRPDVVVSDLGMPDEDGYVLIRKLRALPWLDRRVPVIALTAYTSAADRRRTYEAGFAAHIAKPVQPEDLVNAVTSLLEERKAAV